MTVFTDGVRGWRETYSNRNILKLIEQQLRSLSDLTQCTTSDRFPW